MNRRTVIKRIAISSTAAFLFPACFRNKDETYVELNNIKVTNDEKDLLGEVAETILPETDSPGAKKLEAHVFALVMVDDCLASADQEKYMAGMRSFEKTIERYSPDTFLDSTPEKRRELLAKLEENMDELPDDVKFFYNKTRGYVVQAYTTSEYFLTNVREYKLVPGPTFRGCVSVTDKKQPAA